MKKLDFSLPEGLQTFSFLLFQAGSALALALNGVELSLWLMSFAIITSILTTILPVLGFNWLKLSRKGCRGGWWLALILQVASWGSYATGMFQRLTRDILSFKYLIGLTMVLWSAWLLIAIYSRHACQPAEAGDTLSDDTVQTSTNR
jgi:Na+/proline symporter